MAQLAYHLIAMALESLASAVAVSSNPAHAGSYQVVRWSWVSTPLHHFLYHFFRETFVVKSPPPNERMNKYLGLYSVI